VMSRIAATTSAIAAGTKKHMRQSPKCETRYPHSTTTAPAPAECEMFQTDIAVASRRGGNQCVNSRAHGGKPMPWNQPFSIHTTPSATTVVLNPNAILVIVGAQGSRLMGPLGHIAKVRLGALRGSQKAVFFVANFNGPDLAVLSELLGTGKVKPVVEKRYELIEVADALRYMGEGHARGKIVIGV